MYFTRREILAILKRAIVNTVKDRQVKRSLVVGLNKLLLDRTVENTWIYGNDFVSEGYLRRRFALVEYTESTNLVGIINEAVQVEYDHQYVKYAFAAAVKAAFAGARPRQVDCPADFTDIWQVFMEHRRRYPLDDHKDRWAAVFDHFKSFGAARYRHFGPEAALGKDEAAHGGVVWALLKGLDAPKYDSILKVWHLSREFVRCILLLFQRQGYAYGDGATKKEVAYEMLRVLTRMGNKQPLEDDLGFVGGVFNYPTAGELAAKSAIEQATVDFFYRNDILILSKSIAAFLSVIPVAGMQSSRPPTVALQSKMTGEMENRRAEIAAFDERIKASIAKLRPPPPVMYVFDAEDVFDRLFVPRNLDISPAALSVLIRDMMNTADPRNINAMREYLQVRSRQWFENDAYADLFDDIYAYFSQFGVTSAPESDLIAQLKIYLAIPIEDMRMLPIDKLLAIANFASYNSDLDEIGILQARFDSSVRYLLSHDARRMAKFSVDQLKSALELLDTIHDRERTKEETDTFMDEFYYALELKHEADPSFRPFDVL